MKTVFFLIALIICISCKVDYNPIPYNLTNIGRIEAYVNGKKWINDSLQYIQISYLSTPKDLVSRSPCLNDYGNLEINTFSKPKGYLSVNTSYLIPSKVGTYTIKPMRGIDYCNRLNSGVNLNYTNEYSTSLNTSYDIDTTKINQIIIESVDNDKLTGKFKIAYYKTYGEKSVNYADTITVNCVRFTAERIKVN